MTEPTGGTRHPVWPERRVDGDWIWELSASGFNGIFGMNGVIQGQREG